MRSKSWLSILMLAAVLSCAGLAVSAETGKPTMCTSEGETLAGLKGIMVGVDSNAPGFTGSGLTGDGIKADIESKLKGAGVSIVQYDRNAKLAISNGYLVVTVETAEIDTKSGKTLGCTVTVQLLQYVYLMNRIDHFAMAPTWQKSRTLVCEGDPKAKLNDSLASLVDELAKDYVKANPKG